MRAVDALVSGGVTGIEITYSTPDVPRVLAGVAERHGDAVLLGAGTITAPEQAARRSPRAPGSSSAPGSTTR